MNFASMTAAKQEGTTGLYPQAASQLASTGWFILPSATLIRRADLLAVGMFSPDVRRNEDVFCFLKVLTRGALVFIDEPLARWVIHDSNSHKDNLAMMEGRLAMSELVFRDPGLISPAFVDRLRDELPGLLLAIGRARLSAGDMAGARAVLQRRFRLDGSAVALALILASVAGRSGVHAMRRIRRLLR